MPSVPSVKNWSVDIPMLEVGQVVKPHGLLGEVVVTLVSNRPERTVPGSKFTVRGEDRILVLVSARPHRHRWLMCFEGVSDRRAAEHLRGATLLAPPIDDPDVDWVHELIGSSVWSVDGARLGEVTGVQDNPAADLLVLDSGVLIPLTFAVEVGKGRVIVDTPPGLLEL